MRHVRTRVDVDQRMDHQLGVPVDSGRAPVCGGGLVASVAIAVAAARVLVVAVVLVLLLLCRLSYFFHHCFRHFRRGDFKVFAVGEFSLCESLEFPRVRRQNALPCMNGEIKFFIG